VDEARRKETASSREKVGMISQRMYKSCGVRKQKWATEIGVCNQWRTMNHA
jgi:hypothetical protein